MKLTRINSMAEFGVGLDTETYLIEDGILAPAIVLGSIAGLDLEVLHLQEALSDATGEQATSIVQQIADRLALPGRLLTKRDVCSIFLELLRDPRFTIVGANIAFDIPVLLNELLENGIDAFPDVFAALEQGRIFDIQIAEALHAIAEGHLDDDPRTGRKLVNPETGKRGKYSLSMCVSLNLGRSDAKENDIYRQRYSEFDDVPLDQLPPEAYQYPIDDACNTLETGLAQTGHLLKTSPKHAWTKEGVCADCGADRHGEQCLTRRPHRNLCNHAHQVYAGVALQLGAIQGFPVDQSKVDIIERYAKAKRARTIGPFIEAGLIRADGSENRSKLKKDIAIAYGCTEPCPICLGSGKVPSPKQKQLQCKTCKGRCVPWKSGGTLKAPTVVICNACNSTGKVPDPKHVVNCQGPEGEKTCDGTGLFLEPGVPLSDKEGIAYGGDTLHESGDEFLMSYGDFGEDGKWLKDYVPYLRKARVPIAGHAEACPILGTGKSRKCNCDGPYRDITLTLKPNVLGADTGRVSYQGYIQLFPRWHSFIDRDQESETFGLRIPSFRECIVANRPMYEEVPDDYELQPGEAWA